VMLVVVVVVVVVVVARCHCGTAGRHQPRG
jgi:hypothetical protein